MMRQEPQGLNYLIISSSEGMALMLLRTLQLYGTKGCVFSIWETSGYSKHSIYCGFHDSYPLLSCDQGQIDGCVHRINQVINAQAIDCIVPCGIWATYFLSCFQDQFLAPILFPVAKPDQIRLLNDKWSFYNLLKSLGIATPNTHKIVQISELKGLELIYPAFVKPVLGGGSVGVQKCHDSRELMIYLENYSDGVTEYLIQDFIPGPDAVFGFLAKSGEVVAWSLHTRENDYLHFFSNDDILAGASKILAASGYSGVGNFNIIVDEQGRGNFFLECNPRVWASFGISCSFGIDFIRIAQNILQKGNRYSLMDNSVLSSVEVARDIPYPSTKRFLKGLCMGRYREAGSSHARLAWITLRDPLPTVMARLRKHANDPRDMDDMRMMEKLDPFMNANADATQ